MASPRREVPPTETMLAEGRPPPSIVAQLGQALDRLRETSGFVAAAVSRRDGLVIHHTFPT